MSWLSRWWHDLLNRWLPIRCHHCERASTSWADRTRYVGRLVWMNNGFYEGKVEEFYCAEHAHLLPAQRTWQEARARHYEGRAQ